MPFMEFIPIELLYGSSVFLLFLGLYISMTRPEKFVEITILTTIASPIPSIIALYNVVGYSFLLQITLIGYSIIVLSVSLPVFLGTYPGGFREMYADTKRYYLVWLAKSGTMEYINPDKFATQMTNYTYLLVLTSPIIALPLYLLGFPIFGFLILIFSAIVIIMMPYLTTSLAKASYMSNLQDEFPQVLQIFLIHHRAGETVTEVFQNIAENRENLPAWSQLTKRLLIKAEMSGYGLDRVLADWVEEGAAPSKIKNFIEGYLYTWMAGGNIEAYITRWLEDEEVLWMNRIRSYYDKMLIFAEIAIMSAISPVAVLLIAFLNPNYGTLMLEALILLMPVALYIIPMIYMSSVKPRMATMPKFIPKLWILAGALGAAVAASYLLPGNIGAKIVTFIIVVLAILLPYELRWSHGIKKMEDGILRWLETAMHYMLAGSMPLDAIKKAHNMIKEPETRRLINRLNYSLESGGTTVKGPTPFSTHMLHLVGTGIRTGSLSPELMYLNVNIMYKLRNTIEESKRSVYPAIMLGIMTPILVLLTIGVGIWFANTIALLSPEASPIPVPLPFLAISVDEILPFLYTFAVVLSLTIGAIVSTTHSNYFYSSMIHVPILLSLLIALLLGVDYFVTLFQEFLGITI